MDTSAMSDAEFANAAVQYGVVWLPFFAYHLQQPAGYLNPISADVFIVWRNWDAVWMSPRATRHDALSRYVCLCYTMPGTHAL
eukprot:2319355-Rhodomonas_salina.1